MASLKHFLLMLPLLAACAPAQPTVAGCPSFPADNIWNKPVDNLPVLRESAAFIGKVGPKAGLRLDDLMPINIVPKGHPQTIVAGWDSAESDRGGYPIPEKPLVEPGSDGHLLVVEQGVCVLYELFAVKLAGPNTTAYSGAKWDLNSNALRPDGWTSGDAAGLPIMPGVLRYDEVAAGEVTHALRVTGPYTRGGGAYQWPARHYASRNPDGPMMGQRFRLKAAFDISGFSPTLQVILKGLKKYGAMLADNGMPWGMQHDQDPRWKPDELVLLHNIAGSNMEAVDVSSLMSDGNSGIAGAVPAGMVLATDALGRPNPVKLGPGLTIVNGTLQISGR
jgi:hypothetical protein